MKDKLLLLSPLSRRLRSLKEGTCRVEEEDFSIEERWLPSLFVHSP